MSENGIPTIKFRVRAASTVVSPVDTTLSVEGMAADAKAVGDALALKAAVADLTAEHITHGTETVADEIDALEAAVALKLDADDVADNLTTDDPAKALSAAQGVAIAAQLDQKLDGSGLANDLTTTAEGLALDARQGPVIKALIDALADAVAAKLSASDVVDNMTTADATKALSANQGVALATMGQQLLELVQARVSYDEIVNNLTTTRAGLALDARQGTALKALIDALTTEVAAKLSPSDVVNTLTDSSPDQPLSAAQGAVLKNLIDALTETVAGKLTAADIVDNLDTVSTGKALDARQGRALRLELETKLDGDDIADNLETTTSDMALSARQGNVLSTTKLDKADVVDDLLTAAAARALSANQGVELKALIDALTEVVAGKLNASGGAITGAMTYPTTEDYGAAPGSTVTHALFSVSDADGEPRQRLYTLRYADGYYYMALNARNGARANIFGVGINDDGDMKYMVSDPASLRNAIGALAATQGIVASGTVDAGSMAAADSATVTVTFSVDIGTSNYIVLLQPVSGSITAGAQVKTSTGFTMYIRNVSSASATGRVQWAVIPLA